ncbi:MAG TPA: beta-N-acetylglucosaminidase domain-containing protein [Phycisphaerae bacterium]|nr:beta-N-acetylglucosaminidase domain-containing protein [Phycisphaerae bacterium]HRR86317.1 beta-N-acetylglucosaminidase domain-containing protein [Phycisphaerae bacterium]
MPTRRTLAFSIAPYVLSTMLPVLASWSGSMAEQPSLAPEFPGVLPKPKDYRENGPPRLLVRSSGVLRIQIFGKHAPLSAGRQELIEALQDLGVRAEANNEGARVRIGINADWPGGTAHLPKPTGERPQAYALTVTTAEDGKTTVAIRATDAIGAYYGIRTLIQLLDRTPEGVTIRQAQVRDWPTFTLRMFKGQCWYYRDNLMFVRWAPQFKWNTFGICYTDCPDWRSPPESYRTMVADACKTAASQDTMQIMQLGNPYMLKEKAIRATSDTDIETLATFFELSLANGSTALMLCLDDFAFLPDEDRSQFENLAGANASIVKRFAERIWAKHPDTRILLCPPPYWLTANKARGYQWAHDYLRDLCANIPPQISIVWTGREVTTVCHETADIEAYQELIGPPRRLFLWDNTLKMPPGWGNVFRMNAFLETCDHIATSAWPKMADYVHGAAGINTYGPAEIYKVPLMTAADYLWNPEEYDPKDSLRRALYWFDTNHEVGPMVHRWVNDLHQTLFDKRLAFLKSPTEAGLKEINELTARYRVEFDRIASMTSNKALVETLQPYLRRHTEATAVLSTVLDGWSTRNTDKAATKDKLTRARTAFDRLAKTLEKGDQAGRQHGLVRQELEQATRNAVDALIANVAQSPGN